MTDLREIEFWFDFASTYSYLSVSRIEELAGGLGIGIVWRPFLLGPIFVEQGWTSSPFNIYPAKGRYMWRDMERLCAARDLAFRQPPGFPQNSLTAARIGVLGDAQDWLPAFCRAVFHAEFGAGLEISRDQTMSDILHSLGQAPDNILAAARTAEIKEGLKARTALASELGIFGAPSFVVGGELFWGDDRLEQALAWAAGRAVRGS